MWVDMMTLSATFLHEIRVIQVNVLLRRKVKGLHFDFFAAGGVHRKKRFVVDVFERPFGSVRRLVALTS